MSIIKFFLDQPALPTIDLRFARASDGASGYDLMANIGTPREIGVGKRWFCNTGLYLQMPLGVEAQIRTRSGLSRNHGVIVLNAPGTIDSDYRGECCVTLINLGEQPYEIVPGERVAQLVFARVFAPVAEFPDGSLLSHGQDPLQLMRVSSRNDLNDTQRGTSGHGSTGR